MILVDHQIRSAVQRGELGIENFSDESIQPASYDLRIGPLLYSGSEENPDQPIDLSQNGGAYRVRPYSQIVLMTYETLTISPQMVGRFGLTSSLTRKGLLASTGPQVDPGFEGKLFVSLLNLTPVSHVIRFLEKFLSIEFHTLDKRPTEIYKGPYQGRKDISADILQDLVRFEGFSLTQIQSQFTELAEHVREWSGLATRFDEFLEKMTRQTEAFEELAKELSKKADAPQDNAPIEARQIDIEQAMKEILNLFKNKKKLFYGDMAEELRLDFATVIKACEELERRGFIEGEQDGKARAKRSRP